MFACMHACMHACIYMPPKWIQYYIRLSSWVINHFMPGRKASATGAPCQLMIGWCLGIWYATSVCVISGRATRIIFGMHWYMSCAPGCVQTRASQEMCIGSTWPLGITYGMQAAMVLAPATLKGTQHAESTKPGVWDGDCQRFGSGSPIFCLESWLGCRMV